MNLMPLANLLETALLGVKGESIFIDMLPAEAGNSVLLRNPLTGTKINYELPGYFRAEFQVIVRATAGDYTGGETLITQVVKALTMEVADIEDHHFQFCRPRTLPVVFPLSKGNILEFNVMFDCCFVKS